MTAKNRVTFELSSFQAHNLLKELEYLQCVANRDQKNNHELWHQIANQLRGEQYDFIQELIDNQRITDDGRSRST